MKVENAFKIIAEPNRRTILSLLSRHNSRLERSRVSFVESIVDAQRHLYRLKPQPLQAWLAPFRRFRLAHLDALERCLNHDQSTPTNRKTRD